MIGTLERESVNTVNVMTDRVVKRKKEYLAVRKVVVCPERSRLITESWKETEGESISVRWAKAFQKVLEGIPVVIKDGELIVGSQTKFVRGCYPYTEWLGDRLLEQLEADKVTTGGDYIEGILSEEAKKSLSEDARYWKDKAMLGKRRAPIRRRKARQRSR